MSEDFRVVACGGALNVARAQELRDAMVAAWSGAPGVVFDCSQAVQVDTSFIQLLAAARKSAARDGVAIAVRADADNPVWAALRALGLDGGFVAAAAVGAAAPADGSGVAHGADHGEGESSNG